MRLFVAFDVPKQQEDSIEKALAVLKAAGNQARWIPRENWHVTLKFIGEVAAEKLPEVREIVASSLSRAQPIPARLTRIGGFPGLRRPRVLWAGISDDDRTFEFLAARLEKKLGAAGFRSEDRKLQPHLTVARFKAPPAAGEIEQHGPYLLDEKEFTVGQVTLFASHLSPKGARYEPVQRFLLGNRSPETEKFSGGC